jgi:hypothetical protein
MANGKWQMAKGKRQMSNRRRNEFEICSLPFAI